MPKPATRVRSAALACAAAVPAAATAAGGPFEVDDAAVLDTGRCQVETWLDATPGAAPALLHIGPGCRVGGAELGLNVDATQAHGRVDGAAGAQAKWAWTPWRDRLSVALVVSATAGLRSRDDDVAGGYLALTATAAPAWLVHANLGVDALRHVGATRRAGISLEWTASERTAVIVEAIRRLGASAARVGTRRGLARGWTLDAALSVAGPPSRRAATVGLTREFDR